MFQVRLICFKGVKSLKLNRQKIWIKIFAEQQACKLLLNLRQIIDKYRQEKPLRRHKTASSCWLISNGTIETFNGSNRGV